MIKPKSAVRGLIVSDLVCSCHGKMIDPDKGKPCCVIIKYGNTYDVYWIGEDVDIKFQYKYTNFIKICTGCLPLYVFENSSNHHKISTDDLNARKLNLQDGGRNNPLLRYGYYKNNDGARVLHVMQAETSL